MLPTLFEFSLRRAVNIYTTTNHMFKAIYRFSIKILQNLSFFLLPKFKVTSTFVGIAHQSTPLPGNKIYSSFLECVTNYHRLNGLKQHRFIIL